jgi:hypothetical protein
MSIAETYRKIKSLSEISPYFNLDKGIYTENPWRLSLPADKQAITAFEKRGYVLPAELKELLFLTNGIEYYGGEQRIYSIEEMAAMADVFKDTYRPGIFNIGYFWQDWILVDSALVKTDSYLSYVSETARIGYQFEYSFSLFLERLMYCEFNNYWLWVQKHQNEKLHCI